MSRNLPLSGLDPLEQALTGEDLLLISQNTPNGWKSFSVELAEFFNLAFAQGGVADYLDFLRDVKLRLNSGLLGDGTASNGLGINWTVLDDRYVTKTEFNQYKAQQAVKIDNLKEDVEGLKTRVGTLETSGGGNSGGGSNPTPTGANPTLANLIWPIGCKITTSDKNFNPSTAYEGIFGYTTRWKLCRNAGLNTSLANAKAGLPLDKAKNSNYSETSSSSSANVDVALPTPTMKPATGSFNANTYTLFLKDQLYNNVDITYADILVFDTINLPSNFNPTALQNLQNKIEEVKKTQFFENEFTWIRQADIKPVYNISTDKTSITWGQSLTYIISAAGVPDGTAVKVALRYKAPASGSAPNFTYVTNYDVKEAVFSNGSASFSRTFTSMLPNTTLPNVEVEAVLLTEDTPYSPDFAEVKRTNIIGTTSVTPQISANIIDVSQERSGHDGGYGNSWMANSIKQVVISWSGCDALIGKKLFAVIYGEAVGTENAGVNMGLSYGTIGWSIWTQPYLAVRQMNGHLGGSSVYQGERAGAFLVIQNLTTANGSVNVGYNFTQFQTNGQGIGFYGKTMKAKAIIGNSVTDVSVESAVYPVPVYTNIVPISG